MHEKRSQFAGSAHCMTMAFACGVAFLLAGLFVFAASNAIPKWGMAYAAADIPSTVAFSHGHKVWYGGTGSGSGQGRETHTYHVVHKADGKEVNEVAYCAIPSKNWIDAGNHPTTPLVGGSAKVDDADDVAMVLYYGYGGPGFDREMWPNEYYDGSAMNAEDRYDWSNWYDKYYAMTHLLVSDRAYGNDKETLDKCSDAFVKWFAWKIQGNKHWATKYAGKGEANSNSVYNKMKAEWNELPAAFREDYAQSCYAINPHVWGDTGAQIFIVAAKYTPPLGAISLEKTSARPAISTDNDCYSLKGALYGVYDSKDKAQTHKEGKALETFSTNAKGAWKSQKTFYAGKYFVAEIAPSAGYALDESVYKVEVEADKVAKVNASDGSKEPPVYAPATIIAYKHDNELGSGSQGAASLAGAEFSVKFYAGHYGATDLPAKATRAWTFRTDESGIVDLRQAAKFKVSGDDFYRDAAGAIVFPLGTVSVVETKAPLGYNLDASDGGKPKTFVFQIVEDASSATGAVARPLNYTGTAGGGNAPEVPEKVKRGDYCLVKVASTEVREDAPQEQERILMAGIKFQFINENANPVVSPQTGQAVTKGNVVCEVTTDENGLASTCAGAKVNGWAIPNGWSGALAYGTYTVHEVIPDEVQQVFKENYGTELFAVEDWKITISEEGQFAPAILVNDRIAQMPLAVAKTDAETGERIAIPASFQLFDGAGELVTYTSHYPEESTIDTWTSNEKGELTLPMLLPGGTYTLKEVAAPNGYVLAPDGIEFVVDEYRGWDNPLTVTYPNTPVKGIAEIEKTDAATGEALAGARYEVVAATDILTPDGTLRVTEGTLVATLETDEEGKARTPELYLGTYLVREIAAPKGYALDLEEHLVTIEAEDDKTAVVTVGIPLADAPTTVRIAKVDAGTGRPLSGAQLRVWEDEAFEAIVETGEDGFAELARLAPGCYHVCEVEPPTGYHAADSEFQLDFEVDSRGLIGVSGGEFSDTLVLTVANEANEIGTHANVGGDQVATAEGMVTLVDTVSYKGCVPGRSYTVRGVLHFAKRNDDGTNSDGGVLRDSDGDPVESETTFTATSIEGSVDVVFKFDANALAGRTLVAFEEMYCGDALFAAHEDIDDEDQAVFFSPAVKTELLSRNGGSHSLLAESDAQLVDTVSYQGLVPGKTYRVIGTLMDKTKQQPLKRANGSVVNATTTFTPRSANGKVRVTFKLDASSLAGADIVAFERVCLGEKEVVVHEDYQASSQTVRFRSPNSPQPGPPAQPPITPLTYLPQTGDMLKVAAIVIVALAAAAACVAVAVRRRM